MADVTALVSSACRIDASRHWTRLPWQQTLAYKSSYKDTGNQVNSLMAGKIIILLLLLMSFPFLYLLSGREAEKEVVINFFF